MRTADADSAVTSSPPNAVVVVVVVVLINFKIHANVTSLIIRLLLTSLSSDILFDVAAVCLAFSSISLWRLLLLLLLLLMTFLFCLVI